MRERRGKWRKKRKFPLRSKERWHQNLCFCYFMGTLDSLYHKAEGRENRPYAGSLINPNDEQTVHSLHMWVGETDLLFQRASFLHNPSWLSGAAAGGNTDQLQPRNLAARLYHSRSMHGKENKESWRSHTWTGGKGSKCRYCSTQQDLPLGPRFFTPRMAGLAADGTVTSHFPGTALGHSCRAVTLPPWLWRYSSCTILPIWGNLEGMS